MANPQKEKGYTAIANEIMDALCRTRIPGEARQVLDTILRKTYGYNKKEDWISLSQFHQATGLKKPSIIRALKKLISMKIIIKKDNGEIVLYRFNKNFDEWKPLTKKKTFTKKLTKISEKVNESFTKKLPTKVDNTKVDFTKAIEDWLLKRFKIKFTHKKETEKLIKSFGYKYVVELALRFDIYQKAFKMHGWDIQYRLEKRWGNVVLNINSFESDEALREKLESCSKRNGKRKTKSRDPLPVDNSQEPTREEKIKNLKNIIAKYEADPPTGAGDISQYKRLKANLKKLEEEV